MVRNIEIDKVVEIKKQVLHIFNQNSATIGEKLLVIDLIKTDIITDRVVELFDIKHPLKEVKQ